MRKGRKSTRRRAIKRVLDSVGLALDEIGWQPRATPSRLKPRPDSPSVKVRIDFEKLLVSIASEKTRDYRTRDDGEVQPPRAPIVTDHHSCLRIRDHLPFSRTESDCGSQLFELSPEEIRTLGAPEPIYLDFQATTPLDPGVLSAMLPYLSGPAGNPHSTSHLHGITALKAVEKARGEVAALIGADPDEIVFTSGATEANNLLVRSTVRSARENGRSMVVTSTTEHKAILEVAAYLGTKGSPVRYVRVSREGVIDLDQLREVVGESTALVSVMAANNEIGVLQPLDEISEIVRSAGALFHTDAAQAIGKVPFSVSNIDLASMSSHKMYGPMGIGAAYVRRDARRGMKALILGGGQERGLRSGTLPVALCVGFGAACSIAAEELAREFTRLTRLRNQFLAVLKESGVPFEVNGTLDKRLPGNLNIHFPGVDAEALLMRVRNDMSISTGSACTADRLDPSHVLLALGFGDVRAEESVRIGLGRPTTEAEVQAASQKLAKAVAALGKVGYKTPLMEK